MQKIVKTKEVLDIINTTEEARQSSPEEFMAACERMLDFAAERNDDSLKFIALEYMGEAQYKNIHIKGAFDSLRQAVSGLSKCGEYYALCRAYNTLGLMFQFQGSFSDSMDSFTTSLNVATTRNLPGMEAQICHNMANLCEEVADYDSALEYRKKALEFFSSKDCALPNNIYLRASEMAMLLRLYLFKDDVAELKKTNYQLELLLNETPNCKKAFEIVINQLLCAVRLEATDQESKYFAVALDAFNSCTDYVRYHQECMQLANYLLEKKNWHELEEMFKKLTPKLGVNQFIGMELEIFDIQIKMFEATGQRDRMAAASYHYYRLNQKQKADAQKTFGSIISLKGALAAEEQKNAALTTQAETDELSQLPNRRNLDDKFYEKFEYAYKNRVKLGFEMLDVDHFKQCNDLYGHAKGDEVIKDVADLLRNIISDKVFAARYGGDEFTVIYMDMTDDEILEKCQYLKEGIEKVRVKHGFSELSLSQGVINDMPVSSSKQWDYSSAADKALYWVKNNGRNNIKLVHENEIVE